MSGDNGQSVEKEAFRAAIITELSHLDGRVKHSFDISCRDFSVISDVKFVECVIDDYFRWEEYLPAGGFFGERGGRKNFRRENSFIYLDANLSRDGINGDVPHYKLCVSLRQRDYKIEGKDGKKRSIGDIE